MKSLYLTLFLFISILSYSQDSSFHLKDYKYRTAGFQALSVNIGLSGSLVENKQSASLVNSTKSFSLQPSNISYSKIVSTDKRLHQSTLSFLPSGDFWKNKSANQDAKNSSLTTGLRWEQNDRFYKNGSSFLEFGNSLDASYYHRKTKESLLDNIQNDLELKNTISVGVGKGRIERVQDAQMAVYILSDLKKGGLLDAAVTPALINSFAQLITDINNRRLFDTRRRRIYELTRIDSFLRATGLADKTDIRHFTTVNDNWAFAINPYRLAGTAWFVRLKPGVQYWRYGLQQKLTPISKTNEDNFILSITPEIGFEKYIPVNLKWQHNMGASIEYQLATNHYNREIVPATVNSEIDIRDTYSLARFTGSYGLGFFPNTRTQLGGNLFTEITYYGKDMLTYNYGLNLFVNYFIGYRTYLNVNGSIRYNDAYYSQLVTNTNSFASSFSLSFSHILF